MARKYGNKRPKMHLEIQQHRKNPLGYFRTTYYDQGKIKGAGGISKSFLDMLPIRTHSIETFRGYLMLNFISLIVYIELKALLKGEFTVEGALLEMTNLMCKIYQNKIIICEPTKKMKRIAELINYMVPKTLGV